MGRPRLHDEHLRQRLLEAATDQMAVEGPDFSLRPLVASVGTSTSAVYSLFGSRGELLEAITLRAASSFVHAQQAAAADTPESTTEPLLRAVTDAIEQGVLHGEPETTTRTIFAGVHGFIALELLGHYPADQADALFDSLLAAIWRSWATPEHVDAVAA